MKLFTLLVYMSLGLSTVTLAHDTSEITTVIHKLTTGADLQDADMLLAAFREDASLFATNPAGDNLIAVTAAAFADMHGSKRFGGQQRDVVIEQIDISEELVASAKVLATNDEVHYTYYLTLTKVEGSWLIQTFLQRSRPNAN